MTRHEVTEPEQPLYVCGQSERELERLDTQGRFYEGIARRFLEAVGLAPGMRVLDIGCGTGDFSFLAADIVGPTGSVVGIDRAPEPLAVAEARASTLGVKNLGFQLSHSGDLPPGPEVDALIGRFVLMHQEDPTTTLRETVRHVRHGGLVAFLESHMSALVEGIHSYPHSPTYHRIVEWLVEVIRAAGAHPDMGLRLRQVFVDAGLPAPKLWLQATIDGGPKAPIYRYITDSLHSMLPIGKQLGIAPFSQVDTDELERQLEEEVIACDGVLTSPMVVGAWCRHIWQRHMTHD